MGKELKKGGVIGDVTERKQAERALEESEKRYRSLFDGIPIGLYRTTSTGEILDANTALVQMLGYPNRESLLRTNAANTYANPGARAEWRKLIDSEGVVRNFEKEFRRYDGSIIWVEENTLVVRDESGEVLYYEGTLQDITQRKRAEKALKESENRYRLLAESVWDIIWTTDMYLQFTYTSPSITRIRGYSVEEAMAQTFEEALTPASFDMAMKVLAEELAIENMEEKDLSRLRRLELEETCKDGSTVWTESVITFLRDLEGRPIGILGITRDITERRRLEKEKDILQEQFRQSQKMEAVGRLAGGIAHDFNNLLTIIRGSIQLALLELKEGDHLRGNMEEAIKAIDRAADLIRQLLAFSRRQIMEMRVFDLNILIRDLDKMLRRVIGEDLELVVLLTDDLGRVKADSGQIQQVVLNLSVNARDAMPDGGRLTIETANVELDEAYARTHISVKPGRYVMVSISDTGVGMTPEIKEHVFEPFFTTKENGKGTGLGLSTVYGIVKQSGGNIWVYSEPGQGTTFKIYLPRVDEPLEALEEDEVVNKIPRGNETILVVEDESAVRKIIVDILNQQGYKVLEASCRSEVLDFCEQSKETIHLILMDVVLPDMSGPKLIELLREKGKDFKVLFMSGYTEDLVTNHGLPDKRVDFVQKPFTVDALARKVRKALDR